MASFLLLLAAVASFIPGAALPSGPGQARTAWAAPARPFRALAGPLAGDGQVRVTAPAARCHTPRAQLGPLGPILPAAPQSVFHACQVIAYYGYPGEPAMGILGTGSPDAIAAAVEAKASVYDAINGPRGAVGAFHLVVAVAQGSPTADGSWLARMPAGVLAPWLEAADRHDLLVILDIQVGHSTAEAEIARFLPHLANPRVHLALDPEWAMQPGEVPGTVIGGLDASAINRAQALMADFISANGLLNRMLVVHQFVPWMIRDKPGLATYPGVDLVIDTDGFGTRAQKVANYARYIAADGTPHGGMKLFFDQDAGLMTPDDVAALEPQPDLVIYQ